MLTWDPLDFQTNCFTSQGRYPPIFAPFRLQLLLVIEVLTVESVGATVSKEITAVAEVAKKMIREVPVLKEKDERYASNEGRERRKRKGEGERKERVKRRGKKREGKKKERRRQRKGLNEAFEERRVKGVRIREREWERKGLKK